MIHRRTTNKSSIAIFKLCSIFSLFIFTTIVSPVFFFLPLNTNEIMTEFIGVNGFSKIISCSSSKIDSML